MPPVNDSRRRIVTQVVFWSFAAIALFYLLAEHRAHLFGALPFLIILACPLMHLFMHPGHGDHAPSASKPEGKAATPDQPLHHHS